MADISPQDRSGKTIKPHPATLKGRMAANRGETQAQRRARLAETMQRAVKKGGPR